MLDIEKVIQDIKSEIRVAADGKATITKRGLARLLGISHSVLNGDRIAKKLVEKLAQYGFELGDLKLIPDLAIPVIAQYYATEAQDISKQASSVVLAFAAKGIRTWMQQIAGYEKPEEPKPTKAEAKAKEIERFREAHQALGQMLAVYYYANNKPGLANMLNHASETSEQPGLITLDEILERRGTVLTKGEKSAVGMYAATAYRNLTGQAPEKLVKVYVYGGVNQKTQVSAYPLDFVPIIENALDLGFSS